MDSLIDLTQILTDNPPVFPGDAEARLYQTKHLKADGYNDHRLEAGMHAGTHIDGPMHLTDSQEFISDLSLDSFIGQGCLLDVRDQPVIQMKPEYEKLVREKSIVLLYTGHDRFFGKPEYFDTYPVAGPELCQLLIRKKIKMLGMDTPSPDREPYQVHKSLLTAGIYIIENLTNLGKLSGEKNFEIIALPLKIRANSSPARVVARIGRGYHPTQMGRLEENLMDLPPLTLTDMQPHFRRPRNP